MPPDMKPIADSSRTKRSIAETLSHFSDWNASGMSNFSVWVIAIFINTSWLSFNYVVQYGEIMVRTKSWTARRDMGTDPALGMKISVRNRSAPKSSRMSGDWQGEAFTPPTLLDYGSERIGHLLIRRWRNNRIRVCSSSDPNPRGIVPADIFSTPHRVSPDPARL